MKRSLTILSMLLAIAIGTSAARTYVLVVGVSRYQNEENNLAQTTKDAKAFKKVMEHHTKDITIVTSRYANHNNVIEKLRAISNRAQKGDKIIFFFSGHGTPGGIAAYDRIIWYYEITSLLAKSNASGKYCFIDACHAGSITDSSQQPYDIDTDDGNIAFFVACRPDEYSSENPWIGAGQFTQSLLKGLRGKADADGNKQITTIELFKFIYKDVLHATEKMRTQQHPQLIAPNSMHGDVIIDWR